MNAPQDTGLICSGCKGTIWSNESIHTDDMLCKNGRPTNWHPLCKCIKDRGVLADRQAATELEKAKTMASLRQLQDPAMPDTLPEAVDYLIDHSNVGWTRVSELLGTVKDMTRRLAATERELERWRHGETIEGDFICQNALRADAAERERDELVKRLACLTKNK